MCIKAGDENHDPITGPTQTLRGEAINQDSKYSTGRLAKGALTVFVSCLNSFADEDCGVESSRKSL